MSVSLSPRLREVYRLIGQCKVLADVGCDHGKLAVKALQDGLCDQAIATDISAPSLTKAAWLAERCGVELDCRVGDGLAPLDRDEADVVVIAGLGGKEIVEILLSADWRPDRLLLVPHRDAPWVRRFLVAAGYRIGYDTVVTDAKHDYWVLDACAPAPYRKLASSDLQALDDGFNWYVGKDAPSSPDWDSYRRRRLAKIDRELSLGSRNSTLQVEKKYLEQL